MENKFELNKEILLEAISKKDIVTLRAIFEHLEIIDIADCLNEIDINDKDEVVKLLMIFKTVKPIYTAELFSELEGELQETIITSLTNEQIASLVNEMANDEMADFLTEMPANLVNKVLSNTPVEERTKINKLLNYKEDSAGSIMTTEYITLLDTDNVGHALDTIRKTGKNAETVYTLFVRNKKFDLVGVLELDDLIFAKDDEYLINVCDRDFHTVNVNTDQEEVARIFHRYELNAIGVTNEDNKLTGIITIDDVLDVIKEETDEDIAKMSNITPLENSYKHTGVWRLALKCIPWLIVLMVLQAFSGMIVGAFQASITVLPALAIFTTMLCDTGGNSGLQSTTLIVRGLSTGEFSNKDYGAVIWKELRVALIVASAVSIVSFGWVIAEFYMGIISIETVEGGLIQDDLMTRIQVAAIVAISIFIAIILSKFVGASLPFFANVCHLDPAVMSGPLLSTIVDVVTLACYFGIFELFYTFWA